MKLTLSNGKVIDLTEDELSELKRILSIPQVFPIYQPVTVPVWPLNPNPWNPPYRVTCGAHSGQSNGTLS